jgi:hypothetical protein
LAADVAGVIEALDAAPSHQAGVLMSYGTSISAQMRRAAAYVDR